MKKSFLIIFVSVLSILAITLVTFGILGQKERVGFIEFVDNKSMENTVLDYRIRIRYHDKVFRNSDIYGVYPKDDNLPNYVASIKWDSDGSPFGILTSKERITNFENIENIFYSLKIKPAMWSYFISLAILYPALILMKLLLNKIKLPKCFSILLSNSKKHAILIASLFLIVTTFSEWSIFDNEVNLDLMYPIQHPHHFNQDSVFLIPYFLENQDETKWGGHNRTDMHTVRRQTKYAAGGLTMDQNSRNVFNGGVYAALRTGNTPNELRSYNWLSPMPSLSNQYQPFATIEQLSIPTIYPSSPSAPTKILYNLFPKRLQYIDSLEREIEAGYYYTRIIKFFAFVHLLLWALLIYILGVRFSLLYSLTLAVTMFCFPGFSVNIANNNWIIIVPLFPLYVLSFYPHTLEQKKKIKTAMFWIVLAILLFIQFYIYHIGSVIYQLPFTLFSLAFCNFVYQFQTTQVINVRNILEIILAHIKKFAMQYVSVIIFCSGITLLVLYISYNDMVRLQPERKDFIHYSVWERPSGGASSVSFLAAVDLENIMSNEKNRVTYSLKTRVKHNLRTIDIYANYPIIYPMWRLEQFTPKFIINILYYVFNKPYLTFANLLWIAFFLNIYVIFFDKYYRNKLLMPFIFFAGVCLWVLLYFNLQARGATHTNLATHLVMNYVTPVIVCYLTWLLTVSLENISQKNKIKK